MFPYVAKKSKKTDQENGQINPVFKGFNASPPQFFQVVPYAIADICWKFHENLFIYLSKILLTDTSPRLDGRPWNSLVRRETVYLFISCVVPDISWKFHENPSIRFPAMLQAGTDLLEKKKDIKNCIVELYTSMYLRSSIEGVKHNTPNFFSDCSLDLARPSLKIS